jgi:hypothetical protein
MWAGIRADAFDIVARALRHDGNRWGGRPSTASMCQSGGVERPQQRRRPWELLA